MSSHPAETNFGTVTSWLPLTTAWPTSQPCSTMFLAHSNFANGEIAYLYDPTYGISVNADLRCLPPEATTWYLQYQDGNTGTSVGLGPIICPAAYTTATTTVVNPGSTLVGCCPSGFRFVSLMSQPYPGQCFSQVPPGQVITCASPMSGSWVITSGSQTAAADVRAVQVNGYLFASSTTSTTSTTSPALSDSLSPSSSLTPTSNTTSSASSTAPAGSSSLSSGATIGISIGVSLALIISALIGFALSFAIAGLEQGCRLGCRVRVFSSRISWIINIGRQLRCQGISRKRLRG